MCVPVHPLRSVRYAHEKRQSVQTCAQRTLRSVSQCRVVRFSLRSPLPPEESFCL